MKRIHHLEGLRTIFCLVVVTHHILQAFYPEFPQILVNDGRIAVIYFLVLTGFTIPLQIFKISKTASPSQIPKYALFRYLRLLPPVFISVMVAYLLQQLGLICTQDVAAEFGLYRIENYYNTPCSFPVALFDSLIGAFFRRPLLNTPLWTITYEMFGGVLVYAITLGCQRFRYRRIFYFVLSALSLLFLHNTYIAALLFGLLLSDLLYNNHIALKLDQKLCNILRSPPHKDRTYSCINSVSSSCSDGYPLFPILSTALCLDPDSVAIL